jgi:hypothetical protein
VHRTRRPAKAIAAVNLLLLNIRKGTTHLQLVIDRYVTAQIITSAKRSVALLRSVAHQLGHLKRPQQTSIIGECGLVALYRQMNMSERLCLECQRLEQQIGDLRSLHVQYLDSLAGTRDRYED